MDQLFEKIEKEKKNRFKNSWIKLDKGSKFNRLQIFIDGEQDKNNLNDNETNKLQKLLFHLCENDSLNKTMDVDYDQNTGIVNFIKNLKYNEDKKYYSYDLPKKTIKSPSKSKSNIDRHFSKSKTK